jgi:hypothetical protein
MVNTVEELWTSQKVVEYLGITVNNLRQLQFRKSLTWVEKKGKSVFYRFEDVQAYKLKRESRKTLK